MQTTEQNFACPYCWQNTSVEVDESVESQSFIEDCQICCQPIQISYSFEEGALTSFEVERAQ